MTLSLKKGNSQEVSLLPARGNASITVSIIVATFQLLLIKGHAYFSPYKKPNMDNSCISSSYD